MRKSKIIMMTSLIVVVAALFAWVQYRQATKFNANITINETKVGGMTAEQALKKLSGTVLKNEVYLGKQQIYNGKNTKMGFTKKDLPHIQQLLKKQQTFWPSSKEKEYSIVPGAEDQYRSKILKHKVKAKLIAMNKNLKAPVDAEARLEQGKFIVTPSKKGDKYDVAKLMTAYQKQRYNSEIHLKPVLIQPITAKSPIVNKEKQRLEKLLQQTIQYQVQDKVYTLKASELIENAAISKHMKIKVDSNRIKDKITEINKLQSTLYKNFTFKTHSGSTITVKGESYGWAIDEKDEAKMLATAFAKGKEKVKAENIYGIGWTTRGTGYQITTNGGIGNTYAEVSIKEQRIWIYQEGKLVASSNVVTGRHDTGEDTPPGVWYIMYKESPSILQGSEVGNPNYSVKVQYWAQFTNGGVGFHDASWRSNWTSSAYLHHGSGGCVNTPQSAIKLVYDHLTQYEPVVVY
ncbi:L,D-transpeptidase family protein [Bacillus rubiinfantis]|uniref:L,D-transpeptidase family protein n=1 Tax=Bacillus rubiinfantis TaxID=1499680 RepID=UPI0005A5E26B|nr:L,D-transpeptidase family protein [Bacillus rubiinfantis]